MKTDVPFVSDWDNHRVMKWSKDAKGVVVAGGQDQRNGSRQLSYPAGIIVDQLGALYIVDIGNTRVVRWLKGAEVETIVVGGNEGENNVHVLDFENDRDRVQRFDVN